MGSLILDRFTWDGSAWITAVCYSAIGRRVPACRRAGCCLSLGWSAQHRSPRPTVARLRCVTSLRGVKFRFPWCSLRQAASKTNLRHGSDSIAGWRPVCVCILSINREKNIRYLCFPRNIVRFIFLNKIDGFFYQDFFGFS